LIGERKKRGGRAARDVQTFVGRARTVTRTYSFRIQRK